MLWMMPLLVAALGLLALTALAARARVDAMRARRTIDVFGGELRPATAHVRAAVANTRARRSSLEG